MAMDARHIEIVDDHRKIATGTLAIVPTRARLPDVASGVPAVEPILRKEAHLYRQLANDLHSSA